MHSHALTVNSPLYQHASGDELPAAAAVYATTPARWLMLLAYAFGTIANAVLWITFAPVSTLAGQYYGVSTNSINMLSLVFMIGYLPGSLLAGYVFNRWGLQAGMRVGVCFNAAGAALRYLSSDTDTQARTGGFIIVLLGQCLGALGQPFSYLSLVSNLHRSLVRQGRTRTTKCELSFFSPCSYLMSSPRMLTP